MSTACGVLYFAPLSSTIPPIAFPMDIASLLQPISPEHPCGQDLSFSAEFDSIADKRREDDPTLDQGEWKHALKAADWPGVVALTTELLRTRTKDLRLAGWLVDATARIEGLPGLSDGLSLYTQLCEAFWDAIHPRIEDGDPEQRVGNLSWLLAQLPELTRQVPLITGDGVRYALRDIEGAVARQQAIARGALDAAGADDDAVTPDDIRRVHLATPRAQLAAHVEAVRHAQTALARLQSIVDEHLGADGPGFIAARKALDDLMHQAERLHRDAGSDASTPGDEAAHATLSPPGEMSARAPGLAGPLKTRAQALEQLRAVAAFFRQTEPHSPVAYLADKAARWGEMPLHSWLRMVLKDPNALAHVEELLGVDGVPAKPAQEG